MNKKDLLELKRRLKGDKCNINRMAGCYVDGTKNKVLKLNESFLNLETEEFEKFLEIARKTLSGTIGNNILELGFPASEEEPGGRQQFFGGLKASGLENEELLDVFYDLVIKNWHYDGNYLILLFHDVYDIMTRTSDNLKLDESEEVYEYILAAVCPVSLSKPGLSYLSSENRIGARLRDWVVGAPDIGFLYPAFDDRSADIHSIDYFVRDPKDSQPDFIEEVLGCGPKRTKTEKQRAFRTIVKHACKQDEEKAEETFLEIEDSLSGLINENEAEGFNPLEINDDVLREVLSENGIEEESASQIIENVRNEFSDEEISASDLVDEKALRSYAPVKRERELVKEVESLKNELSGKREALKGDGDAAALEGEPADAEGPEDREPLPMEADVEIRVSEELLSEVGTKLIDGRQYMVIPLEDGLSIRVNGESRDYGI